jgi:hypothetical protein
MDGLAGPWPCIPVKQVHLTKVHASRIVSHVWGEMRGKGLIRPAAACGRGP